MLFGGLTTPALADSSSNDVSVTIAPVDTVVKSGENITFEVNWQCGSTNQPACTGGRIEVPVPDGQPGSLFLDVASFTPVLVNGIAHHGVLEGTGTNRKIVWKLPDLVGGANNGTATFTLKTQNWITPDGTTVTPEVTFTTSLGTANETSAPATITSELGLKIEKTRYPDPVAEDPYVGGNVTYRIRAGYPSQWDATDRYTHYANMCNQPGLWALQDATIKDVLPLGSVFVNATAGGVYNAADHTVTWDYGSSASVDENGVAGCDHSKFGEALFVTVNYPENEFADDAENGVLQTNTATVNANAWGQPENKLDATDAASHYLRSGDDGDFTLQKGLSYKVSNQQDRGIARGESSGWGDWVRGYLHAYSIKATGNADGEWSMVDMLPCVWTSPTDTDDTDCATPAYTDIAFGANGSMSELKVHWTTNLDRSDVCTISAGFSAGDTSVRFCEGLGPEEPIAMQNGEWITKFWLDENEMHPGTDGKLFLFGTVSDDIPLDNSQAVAEGLYQPHYLTTATGNPTVEGVTPASAHPLWVTIENCLADNTVTWNGGRASTNGELVDSNFEGRCGYTRVVRDRVSVYTVKRMYSPGAVAGGADKDAQPNLMPGELFRVEVVTQRDDEPAPGRTFTPTVTEILPENLQFDPADPSNPVYLQFSGQPNSYDQVIAKLGEPRLTTSDIVIDGVTRTQVVIDFPDAAELGGLDVKEEIEVGFDVRVKDNTPAGTSQNFTLVQAAEAATGYLTCLWPGAYADPNALTSSTTWGNLSFSNSVQGPDADTGCRAQKPYTVVEGPGMGARKEVKGVHDAAFIKAVGIGSTDSTGVAEYRIPVKNTGNVNTTGVIVYDLLPRVGDTGVRPDASARGSEFDVFMTGEVTGLPAGVTVQYSTASNPCRGELAGNGGGAMNSAPAGCDGTWSTSHPTDWSAVTGIRLDFGTTVWAPGDTYTASFPAKAGPGGDLTGIAWNNVAIAAKRNSDQVPLLPTEAPKVGLQLNPDLSWQKVDASDTSILLTGSEWTLTPVVAEGGQVPTGEWPLTIADCTSAACEGLDQDPTPGKFKIVGVPWGTYDLEEIVAPDGYVLPATPHRIIIGHDGLNTKDWVYDVGGIENTRIKGPVLPLTGGISRDAFLIAGLLVLVAGAGATAVVQRNKRRKGVA